ncbi:MAG TPA: hypothetical protein VN361_02740 [Oxalicibacterium sp.]|nr:hypothetical protein [Oxalicibacterium sp.]
MKTEPRSAHETLVQRKERLKLQCRAYRAAVHHARSEVRSHLGIQAIAKTALGLVGLRAGSAALSNFSGILDLKNGVSLGKLQKLLPVLAGGYSLLRRRSLLRPVLRGALFAGGAGAAAYLYARSKSAKRQHDRAVHHEHL